METTTSMPTIVTQLQHRMLHLTDGHVDVICDADLPGRAAIAMLWHHRQSVTIYLVADGPADHHTAAVQQGLTSVRNPPSVKIITWHDVANLVQTSNHLVWAFEAQRTDRALRDLLEQRDAATTARPFLVPFDSDDVLLSATLPAHELLLRDIIRQHARFLNFYGDRRDALDLYERAKYPAWFTPPPHCSAPIPPITHHVIAQDDTPSAQTKFTGVLHLDSDDVSARRRAVVNLGEVLTAMDQDRHDLTLHLHKTVAPQRRGLRLDVRINQVLQARFKDATVTNAEVLLPNVARGDELTVTLLNQPVADDEPATVHVHCTVHPYGTHPRAGLRQRFSQWARRILTRRADRS